MGWNSYLNRRQELALSNYASPAPPTARTPQPIPTHSTPSHHHNRPQPEVIYHTPVLVIVFFNFNSYIFTPLKTFLHD